MKRFVLAAGIFWCAAIGYAHAEEESEEPDPSSLEEQHDASPPDAPAHNALAHRSCGRGPRRVPKPRGAAYRRAQKLSLGTQKAGSHLLGKAPEVRWVRAARGRVPKSLLWPVPKGKFSRGFGFTRENLPKTRHEGIDILAPKGAPVRAAADGMVGYSDNDLCGYGNVVLIIHSNGWVTLYAHNDRVFVQAGTRVKRGDVIAQVGATGLARGSHLHFELHDKGRARDPAEFIRGLRSKAKKEKAHQAKKSKKRKRAKSSNK